MKGKLAPLILMLILSVALMAAQPAQAQVGGVYDYVRAIDSKVPQTSTMEVLGKNSDTSDIFYFKEIIPYGSFEIKLAHYTTTGDSIYYPSLFYKFIDVDGKYVGADSTGGWTSILTSKADSSLVAAITANDTIRWKKSYDFRTSGPYAIAFKTTGIAGQDSCRMLVRIIGVKRNKYEAYPPIW